MGGPEEGHTDDQRDGAPLLRGKAVSWDCSGCRGEGSEDLLLQDFQYLMGAYKKDRDKLFSKVCCYRTRDNSFKLKKGRFTVNIRRKVFLE